MHPPMNSYDYTLKNPASGQPVAICYLKTQYLLSINPIIAITGRENIFPLNTPKCKTEFDTKTNASVIV